MNSMIGCCTSFRCHGLSCKAIIGEVTTADTCAISPDGDWTQANVTVTSGGRSYVLGKFKPNEQFERPDSLDRFNVSISKSDNKIVVSLILNLTAPTSEVCSWDGSYTVSCSILMNDTTQTKASNGTEIFLTGKYQTHYAMTIFRPTKKAKKRLIYNKTL